MGAACYELLGFETVDGELVAIQIAGVRRVGVRRPVTRAGGAFVLTAGAQRRLMKCLNLRPALRLETDGHAVAHAGGLSVCGFEHEEGWLVHAPDRAVVAQVGQAFEAQLSECFVVELTGLRQIVSANGYVSENRHGSLLHGWVVL